jgi:hypothetical protein
MARIVEFLKMARPKIVRSKEEAAAVPLHLPLQVELELRPMTPQEKMHLALEKWRQAQRRTKRVAEQLRAK